MANSSEEASGQPRTRLPQQASDSESATDPATRPAAEASADVIPEATHDPAPEAVPEPSSGRPARTENAGADLDPAAGARSIAPQVPGPGRNPWWKTNEFIITLVTGLVITVAGGVVSLVTDSLKNDSGSNANGATQAKGRSAAATPAATGDPLRVLKVTHIPRINDHTWMTAEMVGPAALARLNGSVAKASDKGPLAEEADPVMRAAGAVESTMSTVELELEGNRPQTVRILGVRAVAQCRAPLSGTLFYGPSQGATDTVKLGFDLDSPSPIAHYARSDPNGRAPHFAGDYFADHKYTLNQGDEVTFRLSARTFKGYCEYRYRFDLIVDGKAFPQVIDDDHRPFTVTAPIAPDPSEPLRVNCHPYQRIYVARNLIPFVDATKLPPWVDRAGKGSKAIDCADGS